MCNRHDLPPIDHDPECFVSQRVKRKDELLDTKCPLDIDKALERMVKAMRNVIVFLIVAVVITCFWSVYKFYTVLDEPYIPPQDWSQQ